MKGNQNNLARIITSHL